MFVVFLLIFLSISHRLSNSCFCSWFRLYNLHMLCVCACFLHLLNCAPAKWIVAGSTWPTWLQFTRTSHINVINLTSAFCSGLLRAHCRRRRRRLLCSPACSTREFAHHYIYLLVVAFVICSAVLTFGSGGNGVSVYFIIFLFLSRSSIPFHYAPRTFAIAIAKCLFHCQSSAVGVSVRVCKCAPARSFGQKLKCWWWCLVDAVMLMANSTVAHPGWFLYKFIFRRKRAKWKNKNFEIKIPSVGGG